MLRTGMCWFSPYGRNDETQSGVTTQAAPDRDAPGRLDLVVRENGRDRADIDYL